MKRLLKSVTLNESDHDHGIRQTASKSIEISQFSDVEAGNVQSLTSKDHRSMYRAALEGDWEAAEMLLTQNPDLAGDEITESGNRALHVAVARNHTAFVQKLAERMSSSQLASLDGHGYTACCYAATSGGVEMIRVMSKKNPNLIRAARDKHGKTPLLKAALHGDREMVSYFLKCIKADDLSDEELFDLLLVTISSKMYVSALEILEKNGLIGTMRNEEGITALHLLARQNISDIRVISFKSLLLDLAGIPSDSHERVFGEMPSNFGLLANKLWKEMQRLEEYSVIEVIKNPSILHDATKSGNVEIITMLTSTYPNLIWDDVNSEGHTISHTAVIYRQENIFRLIHDIGATKHFVAISQDGNGNNILHLAAKLPHSNAMEVVVESTLHMQREIAWFMEVEAIVPPTCLEMRNKEGLTPQELFSKEHKSLSENSEIWMRNTSDSCMLVATLLLTIVFATVFSVPGGYDGDKGTPIHLQSKWFTCFVVSDAEALFGATISITVFWSIITSSFEQDYFLFMLPNLLRYGLIAVMVALIANISTFVSAYFLLFVKEWAMLLIPLIILVCIWLLHVILDVFAKSFLNVMHPVYLSQKLSRPSSCRLF